MRKAHSVRKACEVRKVSKTGRGCKVQQAVFCKHFECKIAKVWTDKLVMKNEIEFLKKQRRQI